MLLYLDTCNNFIRQICEFIRFVINNYGIYEVKLIIE